MLEGKTHSGRFTLLYTGLGNHQQVKKSLGSQRLWKEQTHSFPRHTMKVPPHSQSLFFLRCFGLQAALCIELPVPGPQTAQCWRVSLSQIRSIILLFCCFLTYLQLFSSLFCFKPFFPLVRLHFSKDQ